MLPWLVFSLHNAYAPGPRPTVIIRKRVYASRGHMLALINHLASRIQFICQGMKTYLSFLFLLAFFGINAVEWVNATPLSDAVTIHTRFTSTNSPNVSIRFVTNSGVCETTPGVHQISGYLDVGKNMSMVSISFKANFRWLVTDLAFSGSGSLRLELPQNRPLSHCGLSYKSVCD